MLRLIVILLLITSCSTTEEYHGGAVYNPLCTTKIELLHGTTLDYPEDIDNLVRAEEGCIKRFGERSCLIRFIKTSKLSYWAICRRIHGQD